MATTLAISHNIFLTRQERYDWYNGKDLEVIGVSSPIWFANNISSEPAMEVFAKYKLFNKQEKIFIHHNKTGYEIIAPKTPLITKEKISDEIWQSLTLEEQYIWRASVEPQPSITNLLDIKDGGSQWLAFRQYGKINKNNKLLNLVHFVEIKSIEELTITLN